jgi:hypothetical protein
MNKREKLELNPDPSKYVLRWRRGKYILVDRQVIRWQAAQKRREALKARAEEQRKKLEESATFGNVFGGDSE